MYNPYNKAISILMENTSSNDMTYGYEYNSIKTILEDASSPITAKYREKLYDSVINKGHIDFGAIPQSKGDIKQFKGYQSMVDTLNTISELGTEQKSNVGKYVSIVLEAIQNISDLSPQYKKGFSLKSEYVMLEYNTYVYTCVQATTSLLYNFVDYVKRPDAPVYQITLKNNKTRADLFYFQQLQLFNKANKNMQNNYRKFLDSVSAGGKNDKQGFTGEFIAGSAFIAAVAFAIVPVTRELIYRFYSLRANLSDALNMQANFLEMNKTCVEYNDNFTADKREKILKRQENLKEKLRKAADKIKVSEVKAQRESTRELKADNKKLSVDSIRDDVSNSPLEIL